MESTSSKTRGILITRVFFQSGHSTSLGNFSKGQFEFITMLVSTYQSSIEVIGFRKVHEASSFPGHFWWLNGTVSKRTTQRISIRNSSVIM